MKLHVLLAATAVVVVSACGQAGRNDEVRAPDDLAARARVTEQQARATALSEVPGGEIAAGELEEEGGKLIWSFDIRVEGQTGVEEIQVDALVGTVVSREHESAAKEADEAMVEGRTRPGDEAGESEEADEREEVGEHEEQEAAFRRDFDLSGCELVTTGRGAYMVLEPGYRLVLEGTEDGQASRLSITVLEDTVRIEGHATRVVEEREWHGGKLAEVSRNFTAICAGTGDAYYFGEDVDIYHGGRVAGHEGAWRAGRDGAKPGLLLPGRPEVGQAYYQEIAPGVAMDRARVVSTSETVETPAGTFRDCLETRETTPLEPGASEAKYYAPGVGILVDGAMRLVSHGPATD